MYVKDKLNLFKTDLLLCIATPIYCLKYMQVQCSSIIFYILANLIHCKTWEYEHFHKRLVWKQPLVKLHIK